MAGACTTEYVASEPTPLFSSYSNLHIYLERRRLTARQALRSNDGALARKLAEEELVRLQRKSSGDGSEQEAADNTQEGYSPEGQGPRVLVVGGEASGKSSLVKFLANYAVRSPAVCSVGKGKSKEEGTETAAEQLERTGQGAEAEVTGWWPVLVNLNPAEVSRARSALPSLT